MEVNSQTIKISKTERKDKNSNKDGNEYIHTKQMYSLLCFDIEIMGWRDGSVAEDLLTALAVGHRSILGIHMVAHECL